MDKYYEKNRERILEKQKLRQQQNKERIREYNKKYKQLIKDPDYIKKKLEKKVLTDEEKRLLKNKKQREYYERTKKLKVKPERKEKSVKYKKKAIDKKDFYKEIVISKAQDKLTPEAERYLIRIGDVAYKKNVGTEADKKDIKQFAFMKLFENWRSFDETRFTDPFSYYTEIYKRAMAWHWNFIHHKSTYTNGKCVKLIYCENMDI